MSLKPRYGLGTIILQVKNFDKSLEFYQEHLGMKLKYSDPSHRVAVFNLDKAAFMIQEFPQEGNQEGTQKSVKNETINSPGPMRIHLKVKNIRQTVKRLQTKGIPFSKPVQRKGYGVYEASFHDPDGNVFDLVQPA